MKIGKLTAAAAMLVILPLAANAAKAPFVVEGKAYELSGKLFAKGKVRCGRVGGVGGGKSKQELTALIVFGENDSFSWMNDTLSSPGKISNGSVLTRNKNGKKLTLDFNGDHETALLSMASIPSVPDVNGQQVAATHSLKAVVSDTKATINEKAVMTFTMAAGGMSCNYKYTIGRKMKGPSVSL